MSAIELGNEKLSFREELQQQRFDDHRYYHHSRINQSLHLLSATCFLTCYAMLFVSPGFAVIFGWVVAQWLRQIGHFFFEPKTYDDVNKATHEHKEAIKVGYNLFRKRVLQTLWAVAPAVLWFNPSFFGLLEAHVTFQDFLDNLVILWIGLAVGALLFRGIQLFFIANVQTGLVWMTKIITDPFNDFKTYLKSPLYLLNGEFIDPMYHVQHELEEDDEPQPAH